MDTFRTQKAPPENIKICMWEWVPKNVFRNDFVALLENCCLLLSANESYERAAQDITMLTGRTVSHSTQQRLVHRQPLSLTEAENQVDELSVDGGKICLRTPLGQACRWRDYKAVKLHEQVIGTSYRDNKSLIEWTNQQPLAATPTCLGDGHNGIWNIVDEIGRKEQRREILDWYHLMENLAKVDSSQDFLGEIEESLWEGRVNTAIRELEHCSDEHASTFVEYLIKHRHRIVNYQYYQWEGISIGSGEIESGIKQIAARVKLTGAQWEEQNIQQVLKHRCAYLNGQFSTATYAAGSALVRPHE